MIFKLDTEKTIDKNLTLTDKELNGDIEELIRNYSFAVSSFFEIFAIRLGLDTERTKLLKESVMSYMDWYINNQIEYGIFDKCGDDNDASE